MDDWRFDRAMAAIRISEQVVSLASSAAEASGEDILAGVGPLLRDARSLDDLRRLNKKVTTNPLAFIPLEIDAVPPEAPEEVPRPAGSASSAS